MARRTFVSATNRPYRLTLVAALAVQVVVAAAHAASGDLDHTFGTGGKVTTDFGGYDSANGVALQSDGKIVVVGHSGGDFALARYNSNGPLDPSFGTEGKVTTDLLGSDDRASAVAVQSDGKIVAAGFAEVALNDVDFALARYNADGSLDPTFGTLGRVTTHFTFGQDAAFDVGPQGDGKIVAVGCVGCGNSSDFALARYNTDGSLDPTFGDLGQVTTDFSGGRESAFAVALQVDGKIIAAGDARAPFSGEDFALARYNSNGILDTSFGTGGKVTNDFAVSYDYARSIALQGDGKVVAAGSIVTGDGSNPDFALARFNPDGSLDTAFGTGGEVTTDVSGYGDFGMALALQGDGRIVVAGSGVGSVSTRNDFALARYNPDGSLDTTFGTAGKITTDFAGNYERASDVALQSDGKIVAAGNTLELASSRSDFALARYVVEADLSLSKTGPVGRVPTGRNMTYTLTMANNGPDDASGVTVTDQLPASVSFVSASPSQGSCGESAGTVTCALGQLGNGATVTVDIVVKPTMAGRITNIASVSALQVDPIEVNNTDSVDTSICRITSRRSSIPCG